ncbi:MAG: hypothetical protein M3413_03380, partial [Bacteroidota bacterium]|nr:hypothetical protein [Bacteroidota bacterium]
MAFKNFKAIILLPLFFLHCAPHNKTSYQLGEINFTATGKKEALPFFEKGFLLLHSFEYIDAAEEFRKARTIDPDFAMAYWGEAMSYNHPLWRYQNLDKAKEVLQLLAPTPEGRMAKAKTELEKDFIKSADVLYGEGSKAERDVKFASFMEQLYKKY